MLLIPVGRDSLECERLLRPVQFDAGAHGIGNSEREKHQGYRPSAIRIVNVIDRRDIDALAPTGGLCEWSKVDRERFRIDANVLQL